MIQRHKTAIRRNKLSRPINLLLEHNLLNQNVSFFDYGCGHGQDLEILTKNDFKNINGYDPHFAPNNDKIKSDVVNLGYILNVIEDPEERKQTLLRAFELVQKVLTVSVLTRQQLNNTASEYGDGCLSSRNTFQKFFDQTEIKNYIESILNVEAITLEPGIFLIFKNETDKLEYLNEKYKSIVVLGVTRLAPRAKQPRIPRVLKPKIDDLIRKSPHLGMVLDYIYETARLPNRQECEAYESLLIGYKSKRRVDRIINESLDHALYQSCREQRLSHLLIFFAIRRFEKFGFPKQKDLPLKLKKDIKEFFVSYRDCLKHAENLLHSIGNQDVIEGAFKNCFVGKILPQGLYIHANCLTHLPAPLQVLVGVARSLLGHIKETTILKISVAKCKVSFLIYENFDKVAHPKLLYSYAVNVPTNNIKFWEFRNRDNPPILHRKETFVDKSYRHFQKFKKLTHQEEKYNLLSNPLIGTFNGWQEILNSNELTIKGHRLVKTAVKKASLVA